MSDLVVSFLGMTTSEVSTSQTIRTIAVQCHGNIIINLRSWPAGYPIWRCAPFPVSR